jgi:biotin carboxyl carrier protein
MKMLSFALLVSVSASVAQAETLTLSPTEITEWKAVQARVESRDIVPARARIGGVIQELTISEGDLVTAGQQLGLVIDDKIAFQIAALDAQLAALPHSLKQRKPSSSAAKRWSTGVVTRQRLAQLSTDVEVTRNQIASTEAQRAVLTQQQTEGTVIAPADGRVLTVPASRGAVIMPGEPVATIGSGGFFCVWRCPSASPVNCEAGAEIRLATGGEKHRRTARKDLSADREWPCDRRCRGRQARHGLRQCPCSGRCADRHRMALLAPLDAVINRHGIDFIRSKAMKATWSSARSFSAQPQGRHEGMIEVISGLSAGDKVVLP